MRYKSYFIGSVGIKPYRWFLITLGVNKNKQLAEEQRRHLPKYIPVWEHLKTSNNGRRCTSYLNFYLYICGLHHFAQEQAILQLEFIIKVSEIRYVRMLLPTAPILIGKARAFTNLGLWLALPVELQSANMAMKLFRAKRRTCCSLVSVKEEQLAH